MPAAMQQRCKMPQVCDLRSSIPYKLVTGGGARPPHGRRPQAPNCCGDARDEGAPAPGPCCLPSK